METESKYHIIYAMKFVIPILIVLGLIFVGISKGVITFEKIETTTGPIRAIIKLKGPGIDFRVFLNT